MHASGRPGRDVLSHVAAFLLFFSAPHDEGLASVRTDARSTRPPVPPGEPRPVASRMTPTPDRRRRPSSPPGPARAGRRSRPARRRGPPPPACPGRSTPPATRSAWPSTWPRPDLTASPAGCTTRPGQGEMPPRSSRRSAAGWPSSPSMTSGWPRPSRMRGRVEGRGGDARADRRIIAGLDEAAEDPRAKQPFHRPRLL